MAALRIRLVDGKLELRPRSIDAPVLDFGKIDEAVGTDFNVGSRNALHKTLCDLLRERLRADPFEWITNSLEAAVVGQHLRGVRLGKVTTRAAERTRLFSAE